MDQKSIEILDTTLRDGAQGVGVSFTLRDKLRIAQILDELGVDIIEGGWPASNPKDKEFFVEVRRLGLETSKVAAFSSTRRKELRAEQDPNLQAILESGVDVAVIFGKSWILHVREILRITPEENIQVITDSISYLRDHGLRVIFDAEHFFQGFYEDKDYAISVVKEASQAGASVVALADTNGSMLPHQVWNAVSEVRSRVNVPLGLHMHNDSGCAVANSLAGIWAGARHVQGTINGIGERTGNADLIQIIPNLMLKMGFKALRGEESLRKLRAVSRSIYDILGQPYPLNQPYVGENAFSHKAGVHADAVMKNPRAYEHVDPSLVGNARRVVISELSGVSNILTYAKDILGLEVDKRDPKVREALNRIKEMENQGYSFDVAPMSAVLIIMKYLGLYEQTIQMGYWKVISEGSMSIAVVKEGETIEVAEDVGPVAAVDKALRKALMRKYPRISDVQLTDYRVILPGEVKNTESVVRVTIEFSDGSSRWRTMGVSPNVIEASVKALIDGFDYYLQKNKLFKSTTTVEH